MKLVGLLLLIQLRCVNLIIGRSCAAGEGAAAGYLESLFVDLITSVLCDDLWRLD